MFLVVTHSISSSLEMFTLGRCCLALISLVSNNNIMMIIVILVMICECVGHRVVKI